MICIRLQIVEIGPKPNDTIILSLDSPPSTRPLGDIITFAHRAFKWICNGKVFGGQQ